MSRIDEFIGLTEFQKAKLSTYYQSNPKLLSSHLSQWKKHYSNDSLMSYINEVFDTNESKTIECIEINNRIYIAIYSYHYLALFDYETNDAYTYQCITWKNTRMKYWSNTNSNYLSNRSGESMFAWWPTDNLEGLNDLDEYEYIDFSKLKTINPYVLLNERFKKNKLWQIEMLIKQGYYKLAENLASSYKTIDFKIFRQYLDFFRKPGKNIWHYDQIINLINKGFDNPEYMYLQQYLNNNWFNNWFIEFLIDNPKINRSRFLKYIKNRKSSKTVFGINFLSLYQMYLVEASELKLDLSKDKYAFPQDLIKAMQDHIASINPYTYKHSKFRNIFENWQQSLPINNQNDLYVARIESIKKEENERVLAAKRRAEQKEKFLKFLWQFNKSIHYEINDQFVLLAPTSSEDLLIEGKTLNHCVASYVEKISERKTSIYFLRKKGYEDKPFYTVEIINGSLTQCRTTNNQVNPMIESTLKDFLVSTNIHIPSWDIESEKKYA